MAALISHHHLHTGNIHINFSPLRLIHDLNPWSNLSVSWLQECIDSNAAHMRLKLYMLLFWEGSKTGGQVSRFPAEGQSRETPENCPRERLLSITAVRIAYIVFIRVLSYVSLLEFLCQGGKWRLQKAEWVESGWAGEFSSSVTSQSFPNSRQWENPSGFR